MIPFRNTSRWRLVSDLPIGMSLDYPWSYSIASESICVVADSSQDDVSLE
jgi:hypothetical protein